MNGTALIAIDWGTTSARAYCVDRDGRVLGERSAPLGVAQPGGGDFAAALATLLGDWAALRVTRIASGMIGSRQGWIEAPYFQCPAAIDALANAMTRTPGGELWIVPGLMTHDEAGTPDVMRGEETQLAGVLGDATARCVAVLPGTHSKWAIVEHGSIVDFRTFLTGELYAALLGHTILGRLAEPGESGAHTTAAFARGVARGLAHGSLAHDAFGARTRVLAGVMPGRDVADWLSGLLIGRELRDARAFAQDAQSLTVIGSDALVGRYLAAFDQAKLEARASPVNAAVAGLVRIARAAKLLAN